MQEEEKHGQASLGLVAAAGGGGQGEQKGERRRIEAATEAVHGSKSNIGGLSVELPSGNNPSGWLLLFHTAVSVKDAERRKHRGRWLF